MPPQGRLGDMASCPADAHGCPACAHPVIGPATSGSPDVIVNHLPALRDGDAGVHAACCGPNTWTANGGAPHVIINYKAAYRLGDPSAHCGGDGQLVQGSPDVLVGDDGGATQPGKTWVSVLVTDDLGQPMGGFDFKMDGCGHSSDGSLGSSSWSSAHEIDEGTVQYELKQPKDA